MRDAGIIKGSLMAGSFALITAAGIALGSGCCGAGGCPLRGRKDADKAKGAHDCPDGICAVTTANAVTAAEAAQPDGYVVSTEEMVALVKAGDTILLDARAGQFDDGERIPGAQQLAPNAPEELIASTLPDKDAAIVAYCANPQCPAGQILVDRLKELGYTNLRKYVDGIAGWKQDGHSVEKAE